MGGLSNEPFPDAHVLQTGDLQISDHRFEHVMLGRRAAWSPLWWWSCFSMISVFIICCWLYVTFSCYVTIVIYVRCCRYEILTKMNQIWGFCDGVRYFCWWLPMAFQFVSAAASRSWCQSRWLMAVNLSNGIAWVVVYDSFICNTAPGDCKILAAAYHRSLTSARSHKPGGGQIHISHSSQVVAHRRKCQESLLRTHWLAVKWCHEPIVQLSPKSQMNEGAQIEHSMCGRRAVWSPLWCWLL